MATDTTFLIDVPDIGKFTFRKRRVPDQILIEANAQRMLGGPIDNADLKNIAMATCTLQTLVISAPPAWDMDSLDPLDADDTDKIWAVWRKLRQREDDFRKGTGKDSEQAGA
jgi:hypothetical protein